MNESTKNKKYLLDRFTGWLFLFVICATAVCFGYYNGKESVRVEAVKKGYAEFTKNGFAWNSYRKIGMGIKDD